MRSIFACDLAINRVELHTQLLAHVERRTQALASQWEADVIYQENVGLSPNGPEVLAEETTSVLNRFYTYSSGRSASQTYLDNLMNLNEAGLSRESVLLDNEAQVLEEVFFDSQRSSARLATLRRALNSSIARP